MKRYAMAMLILFSMLICSGSVYASTDFEKADSSIKEIILSDYQLHYADTLESHKDSFHGLKNTVFHDATLGEGIAFYRIADLSDISSLEFAGYKFPLYLDGKQVAVIEANNDTGEYKIFNISNQDDFDRKLKQAITQYKGKGQIQLIDDKHYNINSVYINDEADKHYIDLNTNKLSTPKELNNKLNELNDSFYKTNTEDMGAAVVGLGGGALQQPKTSILLPVVLSVLGMLFLTPLALLLFNKRIGK
ncbi:hypothetical protein [Paenibacillus sp. FSL E2-0178]|uniref:hypothetical protein n=1 Tax=Paenibacillus sp. FSL E2-0178 TaxID=2921361 RepID=UPI003158CD04